MRGEGWKMMVLGIGMLLGGVLNAEEVKAPDADTLWVETFQNADSVSKWRNDGGFKLSVADDLLLVDPRGGDKKQYTIGRYVKYDKEYPYFQVNLKSIEQLKGYKGWTLSNSSTGGGFFVNTGGGVIPGLWTFNIDDCLKLDKPKGYFFLRIDMYGYVFKYKSFKMMKEPIDALIATADKKILKPGDVIKFKLLLATPCKDATVNIRKAYCLGPLKKINETGYVQLTSDDKGKTWNGELKITKRGFGSKKLNNGDLIFQCNMLGGKLRKVFTSSSFVVDCGE